MKLLNFSIILFTLINGKERKIKLTFEMTEIKSKIIQIEVEVIEITV